MQKITVSEGTEKWIEEINPKGGSKTIQLKVNWIIGNWGYDAGAVATVPTGVANNLIRNGKAVEVELKPVKRGPGRPKKLRR